MKDFLNCGAILVPRPGFVRLGWGDWKWSSSPNPEGPSFFAPDFFLSESLRWASPSRWIEMSAGELLKSLEAEAGPAPRFLWNGPDSEGFRKSFEDLQRSFAEGTLKKAVPVVFECAQGKPTPSQLAWLLRNLLERSGNARVYGIWNEQGGLLGATPEDLFVVQSDGVLRTMALAGTYRKVTGVDPAAILEDPKERREHQLVVDDICAALEGALGRFAEVRASRTEVLELPSLVHLKTAIEAKLMGEASGTVRFTSAEFERLARALHPTAALGAFPRNQGWDWLRTQQSAAIRGRFGAPFGALWPVGNDGVEAICVVAIRNIQWEREEMQLGSGCGLIAESILEREWDELALKRHSVKAMMGLA